MTIPKFEEMMLPLLKFLNDGRKHDISEAEESLASLFHLSEEERKMEKPSGKETLFHNRIHWAKFYLKKAYLLEGPSRSSFKITSRGMSVLKENPKKFGIEYLKKFQEFSDFANRKKSK